MSHERLMTILLAPHVSEKSSAVGDKHNQIVFEVRQDAAKREIKEAVEKLFEVQVESVQVSNQRGKQKRFGGVTGRRRGRKKAFVTLKEGQEIDFLAAEK